MIELPEKDWRYTVRQTSERSASTRNRLVVEKSVGYFKLRKFNLDNEDTYVWSVIYCDKITKKSIRSDRCLIGIELLYGNEVRSKIAFFLKERRKEIKHKVNELRKEF